MRAVRNVQKLRYAALTLYSRSIHQRQYEQWNKPAHSLVSLVFQFVENALQCRVDLV
jgi:hypothetical protein